MGWQWFTYYMLAGTSELAGVKWLCFSDLSKPDGLLFGFNLLPFVMTGVNLLTVYATPCFNKKDEIQAWVIAIFFLVLLYAANSALMIYWTLNQIFNFVRTLCEKRFAGAQLIVSRMISLPTVLRKNMVLHRPSLAGSLAGFVGVALLTLLPATYLLLSVVPKDLRFEVSTDAPISIRIGEGGGNEASGFSVQLSVIRDFAAIQSYREFLPPDVDAKKLSYTFDCASRNQIVLKRIRLTVADFLAWDLPAEEFVRCYASSDGATSALGADGTVVIGLKNGSGTFSPKEGVTPCGRYAGICPTGIILPCSVIRLLAAFAAILIVLAIMGSCCVEVAAENLRRRLWISLAISFLASVFVLVILPAQSFWANGSDYPFATSELMRGQVLPVLITCSVLALGLFLASFSFGRLPFVLVLAFLAYEYLQTGVLSIGAPALNGDMSYYANRGLALRDGLVLIGAIAVFLLFSRWVKKHFMGVLGVFALLFLASVVDGLLNSRSPESQEMSGDGFCSKLDVLKNLKFSKRNVIVLVLDSVTTEVVSDVFKKFPKIAERFSGFSVFENNIGIHHVTDLSTVATLTGVAYTNNLSSVQYQRYLNSIWTSGVLPWYGEKGCPVYFKPSSCDFGCILNGNQTNSVESHVETISPMLQKKAGAFSFSLRDLTLFRIAPFVSKRAMFKMLYASARGHGHVDATETIYPMLIKDVWDDCVTSLIFVHTQGAHVPHDVSKDGQRMPGNGFNEGYDHYFDHTCFVLKQTGELFEEWRKNGIYDSSFIVMMSDHGSHCLGDTRNPDFGSDAMPPQARPMLCVKPIGAAEVLSYDDKTPTYSMRISEMLKQLIDKNLSIAEVTDMLTCTNRVFVMPEANRVRVWRVDITGCGHYSR